MTGRITGNDAPSRVGFLTAWYAVAIFVLLYCLQQLDRQILALLVMPVSADMHLSDTQIGLLFGSGFGIVYSLCGLPIAHIVDRSVRIRIVVLGVLLWGISTVASGFAHSFTELLIARSGLAIGEAALSPAVISLIGDMFARDKRALPTVIYASAPTLMTSGSYVVGAAAISLADLLAQPLHMVSWRLTLILVGVPSILVGIILHFSVSEPRRTPEPAGVHDYSTIRQAIAFVRTEGALFAFLFVGMACTAVASYAFIAWTPTFMMRVFGQSSAEAGYAFGAASFLPGIIGAALWPALVSVFTRRGLTNAIVLFLGLGVLAKEVSVLVVGISTSLTVVLTASAATVLFVSMTATLPPLIIQALAPARVRARLMAANVLASTLVGLSIGPPLCAWIADTFFAGPAALGSGLACVAIGIAPFSTGAMFLALPRYARALDAAKMREAEYSESAVDSVVISEGGPALAGQK